MRTVSVRVEDLKKIVIPIGFVGENLHTKVIIDSTKVFADYPDAIATMTVQPAAGAAYPAVVVRNGNAVEWDVSDSDLVNVGRGEIQLSFTVDEVIAKSYIGMVRVERSILPAGEVPEPIDDWLNRAETALSEIDGLTASAETLAAGSSATAEIAIVEGHKNIALGIPKGDKGDKGNTGATGRAGTDGFSPTVGVSSITGGHRLTITDANGTQTVDVMDGDKGDTGNGIASVALNDDYTLTINYTNGQSYTTTSIRGAKGDKGNTGATGATPAFSIGTVTTGAAGSSAAATITGTAAAPVLNLTIPRGNPGDATIDDTAGAGDTTKVWSADKSSQLKSAINHDISVITDKMSLVKSENLFDYESASQGVRNPDGTTTTSTSYYYSDFIKVTPGDVLRSYYKSGSNVYAANMQKVCTYNSSKEPITASGTASSTTNFTVPAGIEYVIVTFSSGVYETAIITLNNSTQPTDFIPYFEPYYQATPDFINEALTSIKVLIGLVQKRQTDFWTRERSTNLFNKNDITEGEYFNGNGVISTSASMFRSYVELDGAGSYSLQVNGSFYGLTNALNIPCFDKDKNFVKTIIATTSESSASGNNKCLLTISAQDITDGVFYIGYSQATAYEDTEMVVKSSTYPSAYTAYYDRWTLPDLYINAETNPLKGKIAVFDGDSICAGNGSAMGDYGNGWAGRVGIDNDMVYYNVGVSGACITAETYLSGGSPRHWVSRYIDTIYAQHPDADYIIAEGGTNDADIFYSTPEKLGTFDDTDFTGPFDDTTFYGAMDSWCKKALSYFPKAKIGFIVAQKMGKGFVTYAKNRYDYFTYAEKVCKKWGIPVLNLWDDGQLRPDVESNYNPTYNTIETATEHGYLYYDGQHLTAYGYDVISPKIAAWMKTL